MDIKQEIFSAEVFPAMGCTEPVSCAYAAAVAVEHLDEPVEKISLSVDRGTFKNGASITVPGSGGLKGNLIASVLGALTAKPELKMEILSAATPAMGKKAQEMIDAGSCEYDYIDTGDFRVDVILHGKNHSARCLIAHGHVHIDRIEVDGKIVFSARAKDNGEQIHVPDYHAVLKEMPLKKLMENAIDIDAKTCEFIASGIEMNLAMSKRGHEVHRAAYQLQHMKERGFLADDIFFRTKLCVASAVDARMAGISQPVMTSGGSGNQGIVATLTPYLIAKDQNVPERTIYQSISIAHCINSYVKCFVGELSVICGCAMSAGIAAAVAIVYQQAGLDMKKITLALNNVVGDLGGLICDGAKPGCAMKTITSVDAAIRSALMALDGYGLDADDGLLADTAENSIKNLGKVVVEGMFQVDPTVLKILREKSTRPAGKA